MLKAPWLGPGALFRHKRCFCTWALDISLMKKQNYIQLCFVNAWNLLWLARNHRKAAHHDTELWETDSAIAISGEGKLKLHRFRNVICSAQRVGFFQYRVGSGRVVDKIPGSGSGSGQVGVSKYMIRYFWVSFFRSGISGYFGYFRVCRVFLVFLGLPILGLFSNIYWGLKRLQQNQTGLR